MSQYLWINNRLRLQLLRWIFKRSQRHVSR
uniref:Uncharacterized protein n=1 Tax=Romanomermis culicivorax TaxID=13658 RepID=A0A915K3B5_ROMCU